MHKLVLIFLLFSFPIFAQNGIIRSYYSEGKIMSEISYVNDVLEGTCYWFYENGNLKEEKTYDQGKLNGWCKSYYPTGLLQQEMYVKDGYRDGLTKTYYENGGLKDVKNYENGKLIKSIDITYDESYQAPIEAYKAGNRQIQRELKEEKFLCEVEICPVPIGGMASIQEKAVYPEHAKLYGLEGIVVLIAHINKEGFVTDCKVVTGIGLGCDESAINAVKNTRFIPGQEKGEIVEANVSINVEFRLSEKTILTLAKNQEIKEKINIDPNLFESKTESNKENYISTNTTSTQVSTTPQDTLIAYMQKNYFCENGNCPLPKGGLQELLKNLVIPKTVKRLKVIGDVVVVATVDEYGNVRDTKVIKKLGHGADEAVEVAILDTHFIPAELNGQKIRCDVKITIPIREDMLK